MSTAGTTRSGASFTAPPRQPPQANAAGAPPNANVTGPPPNANITGPPKTQMFFLFLSQTLPCPFLLSISTTTSRTSTTSHGTSRPVLIKLAGLLPCRLTPTTSTSTFPSIPPSSSWTSSRTRPSSLAGNSSSASPSAATASLGPLQPPYPTANP
jgi:hypothetical protein